jgi:hypothetical protein
MRTCVRAAAPARVITSFRQSWPPFSFPSAAAHMPAWDPMQCMHACMHACDSRASPRRRFEKIHAILHHPRRLCSASRSRGHEDDDRTTTLAARATSFSVCTYGSAGSERNLASRPSSSSENKTLDHE